jgi:membrane-bound ClpP family serine protease
MLGPLLLIIIGILFLLRNVYPQFGFHTMWPVILIVIGLAKVIEYLRGNPVSTNERKEGQ